MGQLIGNGSEPRLVLVNRAATRSVLARQSSVPRLIGAGIPGPAGKDGSGSADQDTAFTAGAILSGHKAVFADGSVVHYASADDLSGAERYVGITIQAADSGAGVIVRRSGVVELEAWSWAPGPVYLGLNGSLTQSPVLPGVLLVVGVALSATELDVRLTSPVEFL